MKNSIKNFILAMLICSAILIAGFSSDADGKSFAMTGQTDFYANDADKHNSEFWSKFRESVMPDEKNPSSGFTGNENPNPNQEKNNQSN